MQRSQATPKTPSSKAPHNGFFRNGVWHCNCIPRLPAVQFTVRKNTVNKGRSFYTCQKDKDRKNKCDFFLWFEDAREREVGAVLTNSRSETEDTPSRKPKRQRTLHESITPSKDKRPEGEKTPVLSIAGLNQFLSRKNRNESTPSSTTLQSQTVRGSLNVEQESANNLGGLFTSDEDSDEIDQIFQELSNKPVSSAMQNTPSAGSKRKRPDADEYSDFSSGDEEELAIITDNSAKTQTRHRDAFETPSATRTFAPKDGLPTPLTEKPIRRVLFADQSTSTKRLRTDESGSFSTPAASTSFTSTSTSTTPKQTTWSQSSTPSSSQGKSNPSMTDEVMSFLDGTQLDKDVERAVRAALDRHAARARGLEKGRDAAREAMKTAKTQIAGLQAKIADLENQRKLDAEARQKTRTDLMRLYRDS
ncbi:uncharacterized protein GGS22DRAFT_7147 [Annulohypoxylon maeteangense]|uniref:uncharacterized protein n=1 Tax=Annulohypoxylon maeteangense TaxID=1927788 RepID=UPI0020077958|nr:uncharacterized protein GGS22DRAFT_7147 [Annulohypoxylon maeteangense]KAI0890009.1 hypothetical protein GGS22DRAFT_7147 [Annulohypoxylon maeteangense]